jgi:hypothetical protein
MKYRNFTNELLGSRVCYVQPYNFVYSSLLDFSFQKLRCYFFLSAKYDTIRAILLIANETGTEV